MSKRLTKSQEKRRKKKLALKAARKAQYEKWRDEGIVKGSRRRRIAQRKRVKPVRARLHRMADCGNPGCYRCHPETARKPRLAA